MLFRHQSAVGSSCPHNVCFPRFQRCCALSMELTPCWHSRLFFTTYFPSSSQNPLLWSGFQFPLAAHTSASDSPLVDTAHSRGFYLLLLYIKFFFFFFFCFWCTAVGSRSLTSISKTLHRHLSSAHLLLLYWLVGSSLIAYVTHQL